MPVDHFEFLADIIVKMLGFGGNEFLDNGGSGLWNWPFRGILISFSHREMEYREQRRKKRRNPVVVNRKDDGNNLCTKQTKDGQL